MGRLPGREGGKEGGEVGRENPSLQNWRREVAYTTLYKRGCFSDCPGNNLLDDDKPPLHLGQPGFLLLHLILPVQ